MSRISYVVREAFTNIGRNGLVVLGAVLAVFISLTLTFGTLVFGEVGLLTGIGIAIGLPGGWGLGRLIESRLFGLTAFDPPTLLAAVVVLVLATAVAGALPALRATRIDAAVALRYE